MQLSFLDKLDTFLGVDNLTPKELALRIYYSVFHRDDRNKANLWCETRIRTINKVFVEAWKLCGTGIVPTCCYQFSKTNLYSVFYWQTDDSVTGLFYTLGVKGPQGLGVHCTDLNAIIPRTEDMSGDIYLASVEAANFIYGERKLENIQSIYDKLSTKYKIPPSNESPWFKS
jgi:hypothetical protein